MPAAAGELLDDCAPTYVGICAPLRDSGLDSPAVRSPAPDPDRTLLDIGHSVSTWTLDIPCWALLHLLDTAISILLSPKGGSEQVSSIALPKSQIRRDRMPLVPSRSSLLFRLVSPCFTFAAFGKRNMQEISDPNRTEIQADSETVASLQSGGYGYNAEWPRNPAKSNLEANGTSGD